MWWFIGFTIACLILVSVAVVASVILYRKGERILNSDTQILPFRKGNTLVGRTQSPAEGWVELMSSSGNSLMMHLKLEMQGILPRTVAHLATYELNDGSMGTLQQLFTEMIEGVRETYPDRLCGPRIDSAFADAEQHVEATFERTLPLQLKASCKPLAEYQFTCKVFVRFRHLDDHKRLLALGR